MRACHLSDTHDVYQDISLIVPENIDILFITGDMTYKGKPEELVLIAGQLKKSKERIPYIVVIPGNHEKGCEVNPEVWRKTFEDIGVIFLINETITIAGINIFGSPQTPEFFDWAFMYPRGEGYKYWKGIPVNTHVLLTHGPPKGILDLCRDGHVGCDELKEVVLYGLPILKFHLFGHIHEAYGQIYQNGITFSNASIMNKNYKFLNRPFVFNI